MRYLKIISTIIFIFQCLFLQAQSIQFYAQIEDDEIIPKIAKDKNTETLKTKGNTIELDKLYKKFKIEKFEKAFPTAITPSLKNVYLIKCNDKKLGQELKKMYKNKIPRLEYLCEPELTYDPNDYGMAIEQSNLDLINAKDAWDYVLDFPKIPVAITDNHFDLNHEDLSMTLIGGDNSGTSYHGTSVAGFIGAISDNNTGIASVAFNTELMVSTEYYEDSEVLRLAQAGYKIINCSWYNSCTFSSIQEDVYNEIRDICGTIVVFGAGNSGSNHCGNNNPSYPASYSSTVAVTSIGHKNDYGTPGTPASNWKDVHEDIIGDSLSAHKHHATMDICAPGYNVNTTDIMGALGRNTGNYTNVWGTSFAAPQVSGTLCLILSVNPCLSADEAVSILLNNADNSIYNIPENQQYIGRLGTGRLDVSAAVSAVVESATIYLNNQTLSGNQNIEANYSIYSENNVTISSGASISLKARKEVIINGAFEMQSGSELNIDVDMNNTISCN